MVWSISAGCCLVVKCSFKQKEVSLNLSQRVTLAELELLSAVVSFRMLCWHPGIYCPRFATCLKAAEGELAPCEMCWPGNPFSTYLSSCGIDHAGSVLSTTRWVYTVQCILQEFRYLHPKVLYPPQKLPGSSSAALTNLHVISAALSFSQISFVLLKISPHYRELIWNTVKSSVTCIHWYFRLISLVCCNYYRKQDVIMVNVRINEGEKKSKHKRPLNSAAGFE